MKVGIIAAGTGERLAQSGICVPKPLVPIAGRPMISRIINAAARLEASSVACIVNSVNPEVAAFLRSVAWPIPLELTVKTTPSSMESLFELAPLLRDEPFLLFTVDSIFGFNTIEDFVQRAMGFTKSDGVLALTGFIDDEKPLWVTIDDKSKVTAMGAAAQGSSFITAGFYYFSPAIFALVDEARRKKLSALRQFLDLLVQNDYCLYGLPVDKVVDVDYAEDIEKAETFLREIKEV